MHVQDTVVAGAEEVKTVTGINARLKVLEEVNNHDLCVGQVVVIF
jgi:hypothetical protein